MSNDKIIAITGHKNEQSIKFYADTDIEDHHQMSTMLSRPKPPLVEKSTNMQKLGVQELSSPSLYNFYGCSVYFGHTSTQTNTQVSQTCSMPTKKRRIAIDSDSEED